MSHLRPCSSIARPIGTPRGFADEVSPHSSIRGFPKTGSKIATQVVGDPYRDGTLPATAMASAEAVSISVKEINLEGVESWQQCEADLVLCLNLIHHAGPVFDTEVVSRLGWERYAERWLRGLREIAPLAVVGIGFKGKKPAGWLKPRPLGFDRRPSRFLEMCESAGWTVEYEANVADVHNFGHVEAKGKRLQRSAVMGAKSAARRSRRRSGSAQNSMARCHLYGLSATEE